MKKNYRLIFQDGAVLVAASTIFVLLLSSGFKLVKHDVAMDPLVIAVNQNSMDDAKEILAKDSSPERINKKDEFGRTPLMLAAYANFEEAKFKTEADTKRQVWIDLLAKSGAQINAVDKDGWSPLMYASWSGLTQIASKLIDLGANPAMADRQGNTALILATQRGNMDIVKLLLAKGADKNASTNKGMKALDFAQEGLKQYPHKRDAYLAILALIQG